MVGLSVVLESQRSNMSSSKRTPQVISKSSMMIRPSSSSPTSSSSAPFFKKNCSNLSSFSAGDDFLQYCFLCKQKLLPGKDIYMYKGDNAFCSEECRCRQIFMDEEKIMGAKH